MPTYAYKCKNCKHEFDEFQRISEETLTDCPSCNTNSLIRVIGGGAGLIFKGSGFYLTDYKNSNSSPSEKKKETSKTEIKTTSKDSSTDKSITAEKK